MINSPPKNLDPGQPRKKQIYFGRHKIVYESTDPRYIILSYKDIDPASDGSEQFSGIGTVNNRLSETLFNLLNERKILTHFTKRMNMREQLVVATDPLPFYIQIYNVVDKSFADRFDIEEGTSLQIPIIEYFLKNKKTNQYAMVNSHHIENFNLYSPDELEDLEELSNRIHDIISGFFFAHNYRLVRMKLKFGHLYDYNFFHESNILLIDELSLNTLVVQDLQTKTIIDFDHLETIDKKDYLTFIKRIGILQDSPKEEETV